MRPDLSIIIVNYNQQRLLCDCLTSIYRAPSTVSILTVVVDNGSGDGSLPMVRHDFPQVQIIANEQNLGFARATNQGIAVSRGRYLVLLNNDATVLDHALQGLASFLDQHPQVGCVGPQLLNADLSIQPSCMNFPSLARSLINFSGARIGRNNKYVPDSVEDWAYVDAVTGACMMIRRDALADVGLLDEGYFMYAEEVDWCYRARQAKWRTAYCRSSKVIHLGGQTARLEPARFYVERRYSRVRFFLKHHGPMAARVADIMIRLSARLRWGLASGRKRAHYRQVLELYDERMRTLF